MSSSSSSSSANTCAHLHASSSSALPKNSGPLTGAEILVLCTYLGTILLLIAGPAHLPCFRRLGWWSENTIYAPVTGLLFLTLASLGLPGHKSLVTGDVVGETCKAKIPIIVLILSFAYLSISLDMSGFFKASAVYVVRMARGDGRRLLIYVYLLSSVLTYFTSNDIVIISMTPLIIHIGACSTIHNVVPLLIAQFIAANTSSMGLLVGSPTNIILGDAMSVSFAEYWVLMLLPTVVAMGGTLLMLMVVFVWWPLRGNVMVKTFEIKKHDGAAGTAAAGAAAVDDLFVERGEEGEGLALGALAGTAAPPSRQERGVDDDQTSEEQQQDTLQLQLEEPEETKTLPPPSSLIMSSTKTRYVKVFLFFLVLILLSISSFLHVQLWVISAVSAFVMLCMDLFICHRDGTHILSYLHQVYRRMPWSIGPFVLCMFILVKVLTEVGFTGRFAGLMTKAAGENVWSQSLVFGYVSAILVNVCNDLPSAALWSEMLPFLCQHHSPRSFHVIVQSLLVGLNPGTYLTIIGALAGLVWKQIITSQPGSRELKVAGALDLTFYGVIVLAPVMLATCLAISAQSHYLVKEIHKG